MNQFIISGRLVKDPIKRNGKNGDITKYTIAVPRKYGKGGKDADFIDITSFGKLAETIFKYLHKGSKVQVIGEIRDYNYENDDGSKVYTYDFIGEDFEFLESKMEEKNYMGDSDRVIESE